MRKFRSRMRKKTTNEDLCMQDIKELEKHANAMMIVRYFAVTILAMFAVVVLAYIWVYVHEPNSTGTQHAAIASMFGHMISILNVIFGSGK